MCHVTLTCHVYDLTHVWRWGMMVEPTGLASQWPLFKMTFQGLYVWNHWKLDSIFGEKKTMLNFQAQIRYFVGQSPLVFVATKPDIMTGRQELFEQFPALFMATKIWCFDRNAGHLHLCLWQHNRVFLTGCPDDCQMCTWWQIFHWVSQYLTRPRAGHLWRPK